MTTIPMPDLRPANPCFSSGPCAKRPGWTPAILSDAFLGRSHRHAKGKARLADVLQRSRALLDLPDDWRIGIVPASDTGAVECALWSMLGVRGVDMMSWESFGSGWVTDVQKQLELPDVRVIDAAYGQLPNLSLADWSRDVVFTWNGTTSGVRVPDGNWIPMNRSGLAICDATSAAFAMELPWDRLDVVTYSWQKVLGGEAAHGMLLLSPRAVERLENYSPAWPVPKIFRLTKAGKLNEDIFKGATINTPSMLAVEDALDALKWAESIGGLPAMINRVEANLAVISEWVDQTSWVEFLADAPATRSPTSICLKIVDPRFIALDDGAQRGFVKQMVKALEDIDVAYDIGGYRDAPAGLRVWGGATVERSNILALCPWLDWAFAQSASEL